MKKSKKIILTKTELNHTIRRIATEIVEKYKTLKNLVVVGIETRGVNISKYITKEIESMEKCKISIGTLDISLYRDDTNTPHNVKETKFPVNIDNKNILLVDDVLFTGRTIRAAIDCLMDFGRPKSVKLAVLIDRGHRELPIQADFVGKKYITAKNVVVNLQETDNKQQVEIK